MNTEEKKIYKLRKEVLMLEHKLNLVVLDLNTAKTTERSREVIARLDAKATVALENLMKAREALKEILPTYEVEEKVDTAAKSTIDIKNLAEEVAGKSGKYVNEAKKIFEKFTDLF